MCPKNVITTTTILPPTKAIQAYDAMEDWELVVVGDRKTPEYKLERGTYISWQEQIDRYPDLCRLIGPDSVDRGRMISFIEAHNRKADVVAVIDDDNYPYEDWGNNYIQEEIDVDYFNTDQIACDPINRFFDYLWHRGFPIQLTKDAIRRVWPAGRKRIVPLVQADLWNGDPDVDATFRIVANLNVKFPEDIHPYAFNAFSPFDSQNTFIAGCVLKDHYANIPWTGRNSDIWASYIFEALHPDSTIYNRASVYHAQVRSVKSLVQDLEDEIMGYKKTLKFLEDILKDGVHRAILNNLPAQSLQAIEMYKNYMEK
jgi:hypothetical protein